MSGSKAIKDIGTVEFAPADAPAVEVRAPGDKIKLVSSTTKPSK